MIGKEPDLLKSKQLPHHHLLPQLCGAELGHEAYMRPHRRGAVQCVDDAMDVVQRQRVHDGVIGAPLPRLDQAVDLRSQATAGWKTEGGKVLFLLIGSGRKGRGEGVASTA